ncbi:MAG: glycosyltransferase family 1 protein [Candidatus Sulfotelmatobacter sp.]
MKTVYINGKFFAQQTTGTQRYAHELLNQFDKLLSEENNKALAIEVLVPPSVKSMPRYTNLRVRTVGRMSGTAWEQLDLPWFCDGDLLFTLSGGAPILHSRNVVTIHDAAVVASPAGYSRAYRIWHATVCKRMAHKAEHIFTVSNFSKSEIVKWYGAPAEKITVTYLGSEHFSRVHADSSALARFGISGKYILAAGVGNPNKNFDRIMQSVRSDCLRGIPLVIAGGRDSKVYGATTESHDGVCRLGHVTDGQLKALYENAACFVFASLYEGFGLPPLEAMASGCPVVVSRIASLPELFDGPTFFCNPYDPKDIAAAIRRAVESPPPVHLLKEFARKFSWEKCARETFDTIRSFA